MEFFKKLNIKTQETLIQNKLTLHNLESFSSDLFVIGSLNETEASVGGVWGEFTLTRHLIKGGIRFSLVECPNALTWTVTTGIIPDTLVIHLTINREQQKKYFIEEINEFLEDHSECLEQYLK
ncbi:hypothetical protein ACFLSU_08390 [Bacteroidota bacterium]